MRKRSLNKKQDHILARINDVLSILEEEIVDKFHEPEFPIIFVVGAQRSGTTLITQLLIEHYNLSYPNNLVSRFWKSPYLGTVLFESLDLTSELISHESSYGSTKGVLGTHEFSFFWKRWFKDAAEHGQKNDLSSYQAERLVKELASWQMIKNQPLIFKNLLEVIPNIDVLSKVLTRAVFINIVREDINVIQSTYEARLNYGGDYSSWFGVKPYNVKELMEIQNPLKQITSQVFSVKDQIFGSLSSLSKDRYINISYEELVNSPNKVLMDIEGYFRLKEWRKFEKKDVISKLELRNNLRFNEHEMKVVECHLQYLKKRNQYE